MLTALFRLMDLMKGLLDVMYTRGVYSVVRR